MDTLFVSFDGASRSGAETGVKVPNGNRPRGPINESWSHGGNKDDLSVDSQKCRPQAERLKRYSPEMKYHRRSTTSSTWKTISVHQSTGNGGQAPAGS